MHRAPCPNGADPCPLSRFRDVDEPVAGSAPLQSDLHFRALVEACAEGVYLVDTSGVCRCANPAVGEMLGHDVEALIGTDIHAVIHHSHADGAPFPRADCPLYRAAVAGIVDTAGDAFLGIDDDGVITGWNEAARTLLGWTAEGAVGRQVMDTVVPVQHRPECTRRLQALPEVPDQDFPRGPVEMVLRRKDGREVTTELTVGRMRQGDRYTFHAFLRDVTARRAAARSLERSEALHRLLTEQSTDLTAGTPSTVRGAQSHRDRCLPPGERGRRRPGGAGRPPSGPVQRGRPQPGVPRPDRQRGRRHRGDRAAGNDHRGHGRGRRARVRVDQRHRSGYPGRRAAKIFDPFFTTKSVGKGTGQGLPLVRAAVHEGHGDTLLVDSGPGSGSTFTISLPVAGTV